MNKLKEHRKAAGLTQRQLADRAGCTEGAIAHIERDRRHPGVYLALKLCDVIGAEIKDVFPLEECGNDDNQPVAVVG